MSIQWLKFYKDLKQKSLLFKELDLYGKYLVNKKEVMVLIRSASGVTLPVTDNDSIDSMSWNILSGNKGEAEEIYSSIERWMQVKRIYTSKTNLEEIFQVSKQFFSESTFVQIDQINNHLQSLCLAIQMNGEWDNQVLSMVDMDYWKEAVEIDARWLNCNLKLLKDIKVNESLLNWLRVIKDDGAFMSSVEITLGLQVSLKIFYKIKNIHFYRILFHNKGNGVSYGALGFLNE